MAPPNPQPTWQPISQLPTVAWAIKGMADEAADMLGSLREARPKPHVLDNATVDRVIKLYTEQQEDLWLYEEQLRRWQAGRITDAQRQEIAGLSLRLGLLRADIAAILELAADLKPRTIDAVLARSDEDLALDVLTGNQPPSWSVPPSSAPAPAPPPPEADEEDEYDFLEGERLTPTMRAMLQVAACLVSDAPIPHLVLLAPLASHAAPKGVESLASLIRLGWLTTPTATTTRLTRRSRTFLAVNPSEESTHRTVVQALCALVGQLMRERDEAALRLVEPHLCSMADAWASRGDQYALMLNLTAGTYLTLFGDAKRAALYLERAGALDAALNTSQSKPTKPARGRPKR